jgi:hypothetical protein
MKDENILINQSVSTTTQYLLTNQPKQGKQNMCNITMRHIYIIIAGKEKQ